ncbi:anti-sigma factor domain-containing protein [Paenibacillus sp. MSJ-34]|uniref:anti-sigma-I factor RsgI family protein n=1 Tax=Paenibacillus sp. MSJ-34 TaxID=2841529 RepID=UPI001C1083AC|nr:anti-sigma factor domain-containing protein [Paenibacillus sp. MSJ-34]MBU5442041.1 anti-sigma factor domain-containing protein [Paenibacillus sp. MSJ-34]
MRGVVMKMTENQIVVLCDDGKFRNIAHRNPMPELGETIDIPERYLQQPKRPAAARNLLGRRIATIAASLLLLIGATFLLRALGVFTPDHAAAAMIAIDINPSVELWVNDAGTVKQVSLVNDDAEWLLRKKELIGLSVYEATQAIIAKAREQGYLDPLTEHKYVLVSVVDLGKSAFTVDEQKLIASDQDVKVQVYNVSLTEKEKAQETGLTVNKYIIYEQAKQMGVDLDVEELHSRSFVTALSEAGMNPQTFFEKPVGTAAAKEEHPEERGKQEVPEERKQDEHWKQSEQERQKKEEEKAREQEEKEKKKEQENREKQIAKQQQEKAKLERERQKELEKARKEERKEQEKQRNLAEKEQEKQRNLAEKEREKEQKAKEKQEKEKEKQQKEKEKRDIEDKDKDRDRGKEDKESDNNKKKDRINESKKKDRDKDKGKDCDKDKYKDGDRADGDKAGGGAKQEREKGNKRDHHWHDRDGRDHGDDRDDRDGGNRNGEARDE